MLREGAGFTKVVLICGRSDLRRGWAGLAASVQLNYGLNPYERGTLYLFCGRRASCVKGICFEGIGMAVYTLHLANGNRFCWPRNTDEARSISPEQYQRLMSGFTLEGAIREVYPKIPPNTDN